MEDTIELSDGRTLGFAQAGDADGSPLFLFHGAPGSRLLCPDEEVTASRGVRLIAPERPGYGRSDPKRGRWLLEWPSDVAELADHLGIESFAVAGWSAGGSHAMATAVALPERVTELVLIASPAPTDEAPGVMESDVARRMVYDGAQQDRDETTSAIISFFESVDANDGERFLDNMVAEFPDSPSLHNPIWERNLREHIIEGFRQGGEGRAEDGVAGYGPWGFSPKDVTTPTAVWHGSRDTVVPKVHFDHLVSTLPSACAEFREGDHHDIVYSRWAEILDGLRR